MRVRGNLHVEPLVSTRAGFIFNCTKYDNNYKERAQYCFMSHSVYWKAGRQRLNNSSTKLHLNTKED